jgi:hypothetical protein
MEVVGKGSVCGLNDDEKNFPCSFISLYALKKLYD